MQPKSNYKGSKKTKEMVTAQIAERWGEEEARRYNPYDGNCVPFRAWSDAGYKIKKGEKALKSITYVEVKDKDGEVVNTYPRKVNLFYHLQVEKVNA
jgi:hypothetical protein